MTSRTFGLKPELASGFVAPEPLDPSREDDIEHVEAVALGRDDGVFRIGTNGEELRRGLQFSGESDAKSGTAARSAAVGVVIATPRRWVGTHLRCVTRDRPSQRGGHPLTETKALAAVRLGRSRTARLRVASRPSSISISFRGLLSVAIALRPAHYGAAPPIRGTL